MFEKSLELLITLQNETIRKYAGQNDPMQLGTDIFCTSLRELPAGLSAEYHYPGIFGLEFTTSENRAAWEQRIAVNGQFFPEFSKIPLLFQPLSDVGCNVEDGGRGHTTIDFNEVLQKGLKHLYTLVSTQTTTFGKCACQTLIAVKEFAEKFGCQVPWEPARNLDEALQSIWLIYECIIISEGVPYSYSWGNMDQYLLPFAENISEEVLTEKFAVFFRFLNEVKFNDDASALNIGGTQGFNKVSRAIIEAFIRNKMPGPMLTVHVPRKFPLEDWGRILRPELISCGQPTLYGEESCRAALSRRGVPKEKLPFWAANSCMGLVVPGEEWQDMWGAILLLPLALELVLNEGHFFREKHPFDSGVSVQKITSYECCYEQLKAYIRAFFRTAVASEKIRRAEFMDHFQNVFVSLFYKDCIARGKEVRNGGVKKCIMIVETMGLVNLADSLFTIKKLVFEEKKYTLAELKQALKNDFADTPELLADILRLPKFGENRGEVEKILQQLTDDVAEIAEEFCDEEFFCTPSLHTLHKHIDCGLQLGATADGRYAGEPLAKNAGTSPMVKTVHTSLILAASCWDQSRFSGGQPLDLWIPADVWNDPENIHRYAALFSTYFERGGLQLQINGVDTAELKAALEYPEKYDHLIVRIGGFSMRFIELDLRAQEDFIRRFSNGM